MARTKRDRAGNPLRGDVAGDPSSAGGPVFSRDARQEARQVASEVLDAELAAESAVPRLFAASYDTHNRRLRFLSSSVPAAGGHLPAARPELLLYRAVSGLFHRLAAPGPGGPPAIPAAGTTPQYVHLSGQASANAVCEPMSATLITAYLASVAGGGDPGQGLEVRSKDGSKVAVTLSAGGEPTMPHRTSDVTAGPLPAQALTDLLSLRRSLLPGHQAVVGAVQQMLDRLAGKRGETVEVNRAVAAAVNGVADDYGVSLLFGGRPVAVRVVPLKTDPAGSFQARLTGSDQKALKTSMAFPQLTAVSRAALPGSTPEGPGGEPSGPADE